MYNFFLKFHVSSDKIGNSYEFVDSCFSEYWKFIITIKFYFTILPKEFYDSNKYYWSENCDILIIYLLQSTFFIYIETILNS